MLSEAGANVTIACSKATNNDVGNLSKHAEIKLVDCGPSIVKSSDNKVWLFRVLYNKLYANPIQKFQLKSAKNNELDGLAYEIANGHYDAVHFINYNSTKEALKLASLSRAKIVYESYECWPSILENLNKQGSMTDRDYHFWSKSESSCAKIASAMILVSNPIKDIYRNHAPETLYSVIYNVTLAPPMPPTELHTPLKFYFQSFLRSTYGIETALRAFSKVRGNYQVTIQGPTYEHGYKERLNTLVKSLGIDDKVTFPSPCSYHDSVKAANEHDIGFLFFPSRYDGKPNYNGRWSLPNKLFVYASAGLGMLFSSFQETTKELLDESAAAQFVDGDDVDEIAKKFQCLIDNPKEVKNMKVSASSWVKNYSYESEKEKLIALYERVLA